MEIKEQNLQTQLDEVKNNFESKADASIIKIYNDGIKAVTKSGVLENAKNVGDTAPNFILKNALGNPVELQEFLKKGKVVLTWYRGGWCPFCNLTLRELQQELPNFNANNATLIALTPEVPDNSLSTKEKHNLDFEVLSDLGNKIAKEYGIVYKLTDDVAKSYNSSFGLNNYNGDDSNELPLAATYIINEDGTIAYAFLDAEYRNRAEPTEITKFLSSNPS
ncbi:peroxiredoxin [Maribacter vaceletii]|uniref:thioredoxin-dependent peroxiredoxin n=1 Tax=Maribacter vaceletii TaxID=1206816 RepID=A0A495EFB2_9FLAO|nr:peroxiredoxin-like family protein [Maribacter vaceletii]RKR15369.1 peroxiredoxin [Maribacter vaceletii]